MMTFEALLLPASPEAASARIAGLDLVERALLTLQRGGIDRITIAPGCPIEAGALARLARRGVSAVVAHGPALAQVGAGRGVVVLSADVIVEPAAVHALAERGGSGTADGLAAREASPRTFALLSPGAVDRLRDAPIAGIVEALGSLQVRRIGAVFCEVVHSPREAPAITRAYVRQRNGVEGFWMDRLRRLSLPVTRAFLRLGVSANQVTLLGLALVSGAAVLLGRGTYGAGVAGALLLVASTVLHSSDGEVARATLAESPCGARLEATAGYLSFLLAIAGLVWGGLQVHHEYPRVNAAAAGAALSLVMVGMVGWWRRMPECR